MFSRSPVLLVYGFHSTDDNKFSIEFEDSVDVNGSSSLSPSGTLKCPFEHDKATVMYPFDILHNLHLTEKLHSLNEIYLYGIPPANTFEHCIRLY